MAKKSNSGGARSPNPIASLAAPAYPIYMPKTDVGGLLANHNRVMADIQRRMYEDHLRLLEDRRLYKPDARTRPPAASPQRAARVKAKPNRFNGLQFSIPNRVAICIRRKIRREVMHALKLRKKGAGSRNRRRNFWSRISC